MEKLSRNRKNKYRSFQVNVTEETRDIAKFASIYFEIPLYKVVENAIYQTYGEKYLENIEE